MLDILLKLVPVFLFFGLGLILKKLKFASFEQADFLMRLVFFVTLPAMVLLSLSQTPVTAEKIFLPVINIAINVAAMTAVLFAARFIETRRKKVGSMVVGSMISNNVFMFPFIIAGFGSTGFSDAVIFDFGNGLTTATITYLVALKYGNGSGHTVTMLLKLLRSPLFWAFIIGIGISYFSVEVPGTFIQFLKGLGRMTSPLILISLGLYFSPRFYHLRAVLITIIIRVGLGMGVGLTLTSVFGVTGQTRAIVILCSAAPIGFMTLTFASIAGLDKEIASELVSASIFMGLIYIPVIMFILGG